MMPHEKQQTALQQSPSKRKRWKWILSAMAAGIVLLTFLILGTPRNYRTQEIPDKAELVTIQKIMQKLSSSLLDKEGKFVECAVVSLTPEEVNVLLVNGLRAAQPRKDKKEKPTCTARWTNGKLHFQVSQPIWILAVNLESKVVPNLKNGKLSVQMDSVWIGWIPLPSFLVEYAANQTLVELEKKPEVRAVTQLFQLIRVNGGNLELHFYPRNLNFLFSAFLT